MPAKQTPLLLGRLVEHQSFFNPLSTEDAQWAIQHPGQAAALSVAAIRNREKDTQQTEPVRKVLRPVTPTTVTSQSFRADPTFFNQKSGVKMTSTSHGSNFQSWFRGKTEEGAPSGMLVPYVLAKSAYDNEIIADLGGEVKAEVTLAEVWQLMAVQANGEKGALLTNGYANIFYVRDVTGVLRVVNVRWFDGGWLVQAHALDDYWWHDDYQVFSRNS